MPPFAYKGREAGSLEEERMAHINFGLVAVRLPEPHMKCWPSISIPLSHPLIPPRRNCSIAAALIYYCCLREEAQTQT